MNKFASAVAKVPDIAGGYRQGLQALGSYSRYVSASNDRLVDGSVDIDGCTKEKYPKDNRWDFVISYNSSSYYLEVHPATGGEVQVMASKLIWLKNWLTKKAEALNSYPSGSPKFTWVHSGKCGLTKGSTEYKRAAMLGLIPKRNLALK